MKGNNGRAARRKQTRQLVIACGACVGILLLFRWFHPQASAGIRAVKKGVKRAIRPLRKQKDPVPALDSVLAADFQLVDLYIKEDEMKLAHRHSYDGVFGKFCRLDWSTRKRDPSSVPMFRDLVAQSPDCGEENQYTFNLVQIANMAREQDPFNPKVKVLNLTAVAFHESRCGSTLVANAAAAMDPIKHRSYSEAQAPAAAMNNICGPNFSRCSPFRASLILKDVIYLMSRSNDLSEERVFFKFQSATTRSMNVFQTAFPQVPWMFVYRDPTQVMMSHVKDDPNLTGRANCLRSRKSPPPEVLAVASRHGYNTREDVMRVMPAEEYCAAHLAAITESAVENLNDYGIPVDYQELPNILIDSIYPAIWGRPLTAAEAKGIQDISQTYSKGRGSRHKEFTSDSEEKSQAASEEIKAAAAKFLQESFDTLADFDPPLLSKE